MNMCVGMCASVQQYTCEICDLPMWETHSFSDHFASKKAAP